MTNIEIENDVVVSHIRGNWRYKILRYQDKVYLLDGSTYLFSFLLGILRWFQPINIYEINEDIIEGVKETDSAQWKSPGLGIFLFISFIGNRLAQSLNEELIRLNLGRGFDKAYVFMIPIAFLCYYVISRHLNEQKVAKLLGDQISKKKVRLILSSEVDKFKVFFLPIILVVVVCLFLIFHFGKNIIIKDPDAVDYLGYFFVLIAYFVIMINTILNPKYLVGSTIIIEDKERK